MQRTTTVSIFTNKFNHYCKAFSELQLLIFCNDTNILSKVILIFYVSLFLNIFSCSYCLFGTCLNWPLAIIGSTVTAIIGSILCCTRAKQSRISIIKFKGEGT